MKYEQTSRRLPDSPGDLSVETFAAPNELRDAHNFATNAQPIDNLSVQAAAPPLTLDRQFERHAVAANLSEGRARLPAKPRARETQFLADTRYDEADPPFRAPSSWLTPKPADTPDWVAGWGLISNWNWSERSTAAFLGFAAGILIIVPTVIIISLTSGPETAPAPTAAGNILAGQRPPHEQRVAGTQEAGKATIGGKISAQVVAVGSLSARHWFDLSPPTRISGAAADALDRARAALEAGRITEARTILRLAASPDRPQLWYVLAKTYDPSRGRAAPGGRATAAEKTGATDNLRNADIQFARYYYQQALTHGVEAARARLQALPQP